MKGDWPAVPVPSKLWKDDYDTKRTGSFSNKKVVCTPWELSTLASTSLDGIHIHQADNKIYARCSAKQDMIVAASKISQVANFKNLEVGSKYWVFGSTTMYDQDGKMVHTADSGWK